MLMTGIYETALSNADWRLICLSFCFNVGLLFFRAFKWGLVLWPLARSVSFYNICLSAFSGCLFNMIIPARFGGLVQAWIIGRKEKIGISPAFGTVVLVRIMDTIMLVFLGLLTLFFIELPFSGQTYFRSVLQTATLAGAVLVLILAALFVFIREQSVVDAVLGTILRLVPGRYTPHARQVVGGFRQGLACLNSPWYFLAGLLLSLVFWMLCVINVYILLKAVGLEFNGGRLPCLVFLAQAFSMGIPSPANAGPFHAATVSVLSIFDVAPGKALFAAVVMHGVMLVSNTLPGILYLCMDNIKLSTIIKGVKDAQQRLK